MRRKHLIGMILVLSVIHTSTRAAEKVTIAIDKIAAARVKFAGEMLFASLQETGFDVNVVQSSAIPKARPVIVIGNVQKSGLIRDLINAGIIDIPVNESAKEGFFLISNKEITVVAGGDDSGALYGSLELSEQIKKRGTLPEKIQISDKPVFTLRGPCIGMQKTYVLPDKGIYNYPYTPELFGFFYDKQQWVEFLDLLVQNRMNTLYLWNGHPFSSLIKLKDY
ncbi:MAG: beta-N-acetylhexosaminidase family protein, partial [Planctomycetota bacterium]